nr:MAG TPA: hypothetical protein [Caudoviricetes sp.]
MSSMRQVSTKSSSTATSQKQCSSAVGSPAKSSPPSANKDTRTKEGTRSVRALLFVHWTPRLGMGS